MLCAKWMALVSGLALSLLGFGCGGSVTLSKASAPQRNERTPAERLARVRELVAVGPDAPGAPEGLVEALADEDDSVKKVAVVGVLAFGDKTLALVRKKIPPRDTSPSRAPNPERAPDELLGPGGFIAHLHPWFAFRMESACEEVAHDQDPALRVAAVQAIGALTGEVFSKGALGTLRAESESPDVKAREQAKHFLKQLESMLVPVREAAKDPDEKVREAARKVLERLGD